MTADLNLDILYESDSWPRDDDAYERAIAAALQGSGPYEVSLVLADDAFIRPLNRNFRGKDKATNVLSFPQDHDALLGDLVLAHETIVREAQEQDKSFEAHTAHMLVHGTLHLLGYDHETDDEAAEMEALEIKILGGMGIKNPYETAE